MFVKWYWLASAAIVAAFALLWIFFGRDRETMDAKVSLETPLRRAEAAAFHGNYEMYSPANPVRLRSDAEKSRREEEPKDDASAESVKVAHEADNFDWDSERHEEWNPRNLAREYGLAAVSARASPRLARASALPDQSETGAQMRVDLTPIIPPALPAQSGPSRNKAKHYGGGTKKVEKYYQTLTKRVAERVFGVSFKEDQRPSWMIPEGRRYPLELDLLNEEIGVAIEYNGYQHYVYPNKWHPATEKGARDFLQGVRNDELKPVLCDKRGIYLIVIPYVAHDFDERAESQIEKWIRYYHPDEYARREGVGSGGPASKTSSGVVVTSHDLLDDEDMAEVYEEE